MWYASFLDGSCWSQMQILMSMMRYAAGRCDSPLDAKLSHLLWSAGIIPAAQVQPFVLNQAWVPASVHHKTSEESPKSQQKTCSCPTDFHGAMSPASDGWLHRM